MSSQTKAGQFAAIAKENGWTGKFNVGEDGEWAEVICERDGEHLEISWFENKLTGPPKYSFSGVELKLHSTKIATDKLRGKPDLEQVTRHRRRAVRAQQAAQPMSTNGTEGEAAPLADVEADILPFDPEESSNKDILLACRGATLIYVNRISRLADMVYVHPLKNRNDNKSQRVYFISVSQAGRKSINFIENSGAFRAVALDSILQVR